MLAQHIAATSAQLRLLSRVAHGQVLRLPDAQIVQKAARCLMPLTFLFEAKEIAVKSGTILKLIPLLQVPLSFLANPFVAFSCCLSEAVPLCFAVCFQDEDFKTRAGAAAALAAVCVDEISREQAVSQGQVRPFGPWPSLAFLGFASTMLRPRFRRASDVRRLWFGMQRIGCVGEIGG